MLAKWWQKLSRKIEEEPKQIFAKTNGKRHRLALDVGTEFIKAVIVEFDDQTDNVIGVTRVRQEYGDMDGGAVANIEGVTKTAAKALEQVVDMAGVKPEEAIAGIAGEFVKGIKRTIHQERKNPEKKIDWPELKNLSLKAHKESMEDAREQLKQETGLNRIDVELVNTAIVEVKIDGYKVSNPLEFQGRNVEITIFNTFAPLVHVGALQTIVEELGLSLVGTVAEPYAVASSTINDEIFEFGAVIVDIGGGTTDLAVVRQGGVEGTRMFSMGGRAFTKGLAAGLSINLKKAEEVKLAYSEGKLVLEDKVKVQNCLKGDIEIWKKGVSMFLQELAEGKSLPTKICLCGGGSALPDILEALKDKAMYDELPFSRIPEIVVLSPANVLGPRDTKCLLQGQQDVTPKSLAYQAIITREQGGIWDNIFDKTLKFLNC